MITAGKGEKPDELCFFIFRLLSQRSMNKCISCFIWGLSSVLIFKVVWCKDGFFVSQNSFEYANSSLKFIKFDISVNMW